MDKSKKEKLEKRGWKVGTVDDFLDLSPEESEYLELKINLSQNLRDWRKKSHLSQVQLAKLIQSSQSRVAKMEHGDPTVSIDLIIKTLISLGASKNELAKAMISSKAT